jgi:hypothetical protein
MPTTTTYGYKKPITGERGYFTSLEFNIDRTDSHSHDGITAPLLAPIAISKPTATLASGAWVAVAGKTGLFRQDVTLPASYTMEQVGLKFLVSGGGEDGAELLLSVDKLTSTSFRVYINDSSLALKVVYA